MCIRDSTSTTRVRPWPAGVATGADEAAGAVDSALTAAPSVPTGALPSAQADTQIMLPAHSKRCAGRREDQPNQRGMEREDLYKRPDIRAP